MESGEEVEGEEGSGGGGGAVVFGRCFFGGPNRSAAAAEAEAVGKSGRLRNERQNGNASPAAAAADALRPSSPRVAVVVSPLSSFFASPAATAESGATAAASAMINLHDPFVRCHFEAV